MADGAVEFLLASLTQLLLYNANLISGVKDKLESLYKDLTHCKAIIKDSTQNTNMDNFGKAYVQEIRDLVYRSEDAVEKYVILAALHKSRCPFKKAICVIDYCSKLRSLAIEIESIQSDMNRKLSERRSALRSLTAVEDADGRTPSIKIPMLDQDIQDNVVGIKDKVVKVIELLTEGPKELEVISITGMPGLGKKTLAKMIFCHSEIKSEFEIRALVCVSQDFSAKKVLLTILGNFMKPMEIREMNEETLADELHRFLKKGKYLIVMEDVYTQEVWDKLKSVFPKNDNKSRILLTTNMSGRAVNLNRQTAKSK